MTTLENRPHTALAVIDVQAGVVADAPDRDQVVANIATLVDKARAAGTPVVWVMHNHPEHLPRESEHWQLAPELSVADGEPVVDKTYGDSFEDTDLEDVLAGLGVGSLVVSGAQSDACVRSTLHGALVRGYDTTLVSDAHTTEDLSAYGAPTPDLVIAHTNLYWSFTKAPGRETGLLATAEVDFTSPVTSPVTSPAAAS